MAGQPRAGTAVLGGQYAADYLDREMLATEARELIGPALSVAAPATAPSPPDVVTVGHADNDHATAAFTLPGIPPPVATPLSANARVWAIDSDGVTFSELLPCVNDGKLPTTSDDPKENFYLGFQATFGRIGIDLGAVTDVGQVNTYSWQKAERAPQVYILYGATGDAAGFDPEPTEDKDPSDFGWTRLADVDAHTRFKDDGGQYGVSVVAANGSLGRYRFLMLAIARGSPALATGNTFYSEVTVVPAAK